MQAVILAAGAGTRLGRYSDDRPKGMLSVEGRTLIKHQLDAFRAFRFDPVVIVRGALAHRIRYPGVTYASNPQWRHTNMVESLSCARAHFDQDTIVTYADIRFDTELLQRVLNTPGDVVVAVDVDWKAYWLRRYGSTQIDTESLTLDLDERIIELGMPEADAADIDGRFVGVTRFSRAALAESMHVYDEARREFDDKPWGPSGRPPQQACMTDLLQMLIDRGLDVRAAVVRGGWLEFDTEEDYEQQRHGLAPAAAIGTPG